jgi:AraC-like DNA-binding protein
MRKKSSRTVSHKSQKGVFGPFNIFRKGPCHLIEPHDHDYWEMVYIYSGKGDIKLGEKEHSFKANQCIITPPGVNHSFVSSKGTTHDQVSFSIYPDFFVKQKPVSVDTSYFLNKFYKNNNLIINIPLDSINLFEGIIKNIFIEYSKHSDSKTNSLTSEIARIFLLLNKIIGNSKNEFKHLKGITPIIERSLYFIEQQFNKINSLDDLLEHEKINSRYFIRKFKEDVGLTPINYINRLRIEKAKDLLINTSTPITVISIDIGFKDHRFFNRLFKRYLNCTPKGFRENFNKSQYADFKNWDRFS